MPANVRGIGLQVESTAQVRLTNAAGEEIAAALEEPAKDSVAATYGEKLLVPTTPLPLGRYELRAADATAVFTVVDRAALPEPAIRITVGNPRPAQVRVAGGAQCVETLDASAIDVTVSLSTDYAPYAAVAAFEAIKPSPSGWVWTLGTAGPFEIAEEGLPASLSRTYTLARKCSDGPARSTISARVRVRGLEGADAEATAEVPFAACPSRSVPAGPLIESEPTSAPSATQNERGCNASGASAGALDAIVVLAASVLARVRRRRRAQSS